MPPRTTHLHLQVRLALQWSRRHVNQRLIEQACGCSTVRGGGGFKRQVRARLCRWHSCGGECLPPTTTHLNLQVRLLLQRSCRRHVKLRLIEQACGCSTVRGRGGLKEDTRVCVLVSGTLVVESQDHALPTAVVIAFATEPPPLCKAHPTDRASLPLLHGARRRRPQGGAACSSLPLALIQWRVLATKAHALAPAGACALSAETPPCEATTDRARLWLLHVYVTRCVLTLQ